MLLFLSGDHHSVLILDVYMIIGFYDTACSYESVHVGTVYMFICLSLSLKLYV